MRPAVLLPTGLAYIAAALLAGCQGSSDSNAVTPPPPTPSITVSVNASSVSILQGGSGTVAVTITRNGGYTGSVDLSLQGAPTGVAGTFNPASLPSGGVSASLVVAVDPAAAAGSYAVTIRGRGQGVSDNTASLVVQVAAAVVDSSAVAIGLRASALGQLKKSTAGGESVWLLGGLLADEWKSSDVLTQSNEIDQRSIQTNNDIVAGAYTTLQQARGLTRTAIDKSLVYTPNAKADIAEMYFALGFEELSLAESFCNGIPLSSSANGVPVYGQPLTNESVFNVAVAHLDSALMLASGSDAKSALVKQAASIGKARALISLGQFSAAAAVVSITTVPTTFQYLLTFDATSDNNLWLLNNSLGRYTVSDSLDSITGTIRNALPFVSAKDPRVPTTSPVSPRASDGVTPLRTQQIWLGRTDPVPLVSGIDARLIEAEARLQAGDIPGMMTILSALRTSPQTIGPLSIPAMSALTFTPPTIDVATSVLFRERAYWVFGRGQRLSDLRRLIRRYSRTPDQVFPVGAFHKGGSFGIDVNLPVPDVERTNPNFTGCLDRKP